MENARIMEIESIIRGNKNLLASTDYLAIKYSEGILTEAQYSETKAFRQKLRDEINELEKELALLDE